MTLDQVSAKLRLHQGAEAHPLPTQKPCSELGVEESSGFEIDLTQTGKVLGRGMQDPHRIVQDLSERGEITHGNGVDEPGGAAAPIKLQQIGALPVAEPRGPLGVHRNGPMARADIGDRPSEGIRVGHDIGQAIQEFDRG